MKKILALLLCLCMMASLLTACGSSSSSTSSTDSDTSSEETAEAAETEEADEDTATTEAEYVLKFSNTAPATGVQADGFEYFKKLVEEYSEGRIQVDIYYAGSLAEKTATLEGLQLGTIELTELAATDLSTYDPIWDVFGLPYFFDYGMQAVELANDPQVAEILDASAEENGFVILSWLTFGTRNIFSTKEINSIDDMNGLKIRVMNSSTLIECMNALGANAVTLSWTECYSAMQQGTIDAVENATSVITSNGFAELGGYYAYTEHFIVPDPILISKTVYDSLPEDLQEVVIRAGEETEAYWNEELWDSYEESAVAEMEENDVVVTHPDLTEFREAGATAIESAVAGFNDDQIALYDLMVSLQDEYQNN